MIGLEVVQGCEVVRMVITRCGGKFDDRMERQLFCDILRGRDCPYLIQPADRPHRIAGIGNRGDREPGWRSR
jgi:hypothetical protein